MPDETLIAQIENLLAEVVELGGQNERSSIVPNLTVVNANPAGLSGFVIISDDRDGDNILAKKVGSVVYSDNDLVNVMFLRGGEAIAFQQGSQSSNNGIWEIVPSTSTDIFYDKGDVGIGKAIAPDAALEILDTSQAQLRLTHTEDTVFADFTLDSGDDLTINPSSTGQIILDATVAIIDELQHKDDTDNKIGFTDDVQTYTVGGVELLKLTEDTQDLINLGPGSGDVDIDFNGDMFLEGSTGFLGIGISPATDDLHVANTTETIVRVEATAVNSTTAVILENDAQEWSFRLTTGDAFALRDETAAANRMFLEASTGRVGFSDTSPSGMVDVNQGSTTAAIPALALQQRDNSEEMIDFQTNGTSAGFPVDTATAVGTAYARLRIAVNGTFKYLQVYNA